MYPLVSTLVPIIERPITHQVRDRQREKVFGILDALGKTDAYEGD